MQTAFDTIGGAIATFTVARNIDSTVRPNDEISARTTNRRFDEVFDGVPESGVSRNKNAIAEQISPGADSGDKTEDEGEHAQEKTSVDIAAAAPPVGIEGGLESLRDSHDRDALEEPDAEMHELQSIAASFEIASEAISVPVRATVFSQGETAYASGSLTNNPADAASLTEPRESVIDQTGPGVDRTRPDPLLGAPHQGSRQSLSERKPSAPQKESSEPLRSTMQQIALNDKLLLSGQRGEPITERSGKGRSGSEAPMGLSTPPIDMGAARSSFLPPQGEADVLQEQSTSDSLKKAVTPIRHGQTDFLTMARGETPLVFEARNQAGTPGITSSLFPNALQQAQLPSHIALQIAGAVRQHKGSRTIELLLNPSELGRVHLSLRHIDGGISVSVLAERPDTLALMRQNIDLLAREFLDIGYGQAQFSFGESMSGQNRNANANTEFLEPVESTGPESDGSDHHSPLLITDRLDLRL